MLLSRRDRPLFFSCLVSFTSAAPSVDSGPASLAKKSSGASKDVTESVSSPSEPVTTSFPFLTMRCDEELVKLVSPGGTSVTAESVPRNCGCCRDSIFGFSFFTGGNCGSSIRDEDGEVSENNPDAFFARGDDEGGSVSGDVAGGSLGMGRGLPFLLLLLLLSGGVSWTTSGK